jgi:elongation factor P
VKYLYADGDHRNFMDTDTFEQIMLNASAMGDAERFVRENDVVDLLTYDGEPIDIELPPAVVLAVTEPDPGLKGDTASGATKPATLETGLVVSVPLFINIGDNLKIDTRTGEYIERVS